jgi:ABC-2 type transport system permease protein
MTPRHAARAFVAVTARELARFVRQGGRFAASLVRPLLWLVIFAAGFQTVFGVSIIPPYETYVTYQLYIVPGLLGMVLLFNGMQSSLALVYDREMGMMRLLLTAPLPRWYLLLAKLGAGTLVSVLQAYVFLLIAVVLGVEVPLAGLLRVLPVLLLAGMMLGALGLLLSVHVKQLENFAGTMNFVIFPMFFLSSALYPLWKLEESGATVVHRLAQLNPFTHAVEAIRFALHGQVELVSIAVVMGCLIAFFVLAVWGYSPQRSAVRSAISDRAGGAAADTAPLRVPRAR